MNTTCQVSVPRQGHTLEDHLHSYSKLRDPLQLAQVHILLMCIRQEKRAQRLTFSVRRPSGGVGAFQVKGWRSKSSFPHSKPKETTFSSQISCFILPGCPGPLGVSEKSVQKNVLFFQPPFFSPPNVFAFTKHLSFESKESQGHDLPIE